jgi:hypothetical protein
LARPRTVYAFPPITATTIRILPTDSFFDVTVLEGDVGAGARSPIRSLPVDASARTGCVGEPRPGMTLMSATALDVVMTYTVTPESDGATCRVKIIGSGRRGRRRRHHGARSLLPRYGRSSSGSWPSTRR